MKPYCSIETLESRIAPATFTVTSLADAGTGSLRQAMLDANSAAGADEIVFQGALRGTIKLESNLPVINDDVSISGPRDGVADDIVINGREAHSIFEINGASVGIADLTVTKGFSNKGGAGVYINAAAETITLTNLTISKHGSTSSAPGAPAYAAGVFILDGIVEIEDSRITGNTSSGSKGDAINASGSAYGGGIFSQGQLTIEESVISGNIAKGGSGKAGTGANGAGAFGGGIYSSVSAKTTIIDSKLSKNQALGGKGGAEDAGTGGKGGVAAGGGIFNFNSTVSVIDSSIQKSIAKGGKGGAGEVGGNGSSGTGGGISNIGTGVFEIESSKVSGNQASGGKSGGAGGSSSRGYGGGFYNSSDLSINTSTISGNKAATGGGLYVKESADVKSSTFSGNNAKNGGGIYIRNGLLEVSHTTISGNTASSNGGGIFKLDGDLDLLNSTIAANTAKNGGGLYSDSVSDLPNIISSIIAKNTAGKNADIFGRVEATNSLIGKITSGMELVIDVDNLVNLNPKLGELQNNGGPTFTMLPKAGSAVIDAGSNPLAVLFDQRGTPFVRMFGPAVDIGAVEVQ